MPFLKAQKIAKSTLFIISVFLSTSTNAYVIAEENKLIQTLSDIQNEKEINIKLNEIENIIEKNNLEIKSEKFKVEQKKLLLRGAISARYPSVNLSSNGLPSYLNGYTYNKPNSNTNTLSRRLSTSFGAEAKWDLINPLREPEINLAKDEFEKAKFSYLIKLRDTKVKALKEYYLYQQAIEELKIAKESLEFSEIALKESQIRLKTGIGTKLELLEAKTQVSRDKKMLSNKTGNKKIRQRSLTNILNLPEKTKANITSKPKLLGLWYINLEKSIENAYRYSKELNNILLDISISNNNATASIAATKPTMSIYNNLTTTFNQGQTLVPSPNMDNKSSIINNTIGINATWKLIDGGKARSNYLYNKNKAEQSQNDFKIKKRKVREEVEKSFFNLKTEQQNIISTYNEVETAEESLRLANLRFKSGITTQREIVNQQRDLTEAKVNHIKSITNYNIHLSELSRQTGLDEIKSCQENKNLLTGLKKTNLIINLKQISLLPLCK